MKKQATERHIGAYVFIFPAVAFMLFFVGYPILYNIIISFKKVDLMTLSSGDSSFIGLQNYFTIFKNSVFRTSIKNTLFFSFMCIILQFFIGFSLALFFNQNFRTANFIRGLIMVAWLIPITITALNAKFMFSMQGGIINYILLRFHFIKEPIPWLVAPRSAMWSLILTNVWIGIPFNMILLVTGLSTISEYIYEAADIDGAKWYHKIWFITIPGIKHSIYAVLTLGFIYTFKVFDLVFIMTNGGPVNATEVMSTLAYRYSFNQFNFGLGASTANILCFILLCISMLYLYIVKKEEQ